jgi:hypothetical protein
LSLSFVSSSSLVVVLFFSVSLWVGFSLFIIIIYLFIYGFCVFGWVFSRYKLFF